MEPTVGRGATLTIMHAYGLSPLNHSIVTYSFTEPKKHPAPRSSFRNFDSRNEGARLVLFD